jgi:hypothetical protein
VAKFIFTKDEGQDLDTINFFLNPTNYFYKELSKDIYKDHPILKGGASQRQKYIEDYYKKNNGKIDEYLDKINTNWQRKWNEIENTLSKIFHTSWEGIDEIFCNVGVARIYPRDIKKNSLSISYLDPIEDSEATILHEVTHLLYFKKWHELFPNDSHNSFEAPHKFWHLSEIVTPIIDSDKRLKNLVPNAVTQSYPQYDNVFDEFKENYLRFKNVEDYLKFARNEILKIKI